MEEIIDVSDLFFGDEMQQADEIMQSTSKDYTPRQIGSIAKYVTPVNINVSLSVVDEIFKNDNTLTAVPVEENEHVIGIIEKTVAEDITKEAIRKFSTTSASFSHHTDNTDYTLIHYVHRLDDVIVTLDANDYIEKDLQKITDINKKHDISDFLVFDNKHGERKFLGIAKLSNFLERIAQIREQDLEKAASVQTGQFPDREYLDKLPYKVTAWNRMANSLGGDIYQALRINDDENFIGVFDVSGKNVAASLLTMAVAAFFKLNNNNMQLSEKPVSFVSMLDKHIANIITDGNFITGVLCYFNTKNNIVYIFNCGHTTTYLYYKATDGNVKSINIAPKLPPFGMNIITENLVNRKNEKPYTVIKLQQGMHIDLYSDGLTDMYNKKFEVFGDNGAQSFFNELYAESEKTVENKIRQFVDSYTDETVIPDDITVLDIRL